MRAELSIEIARPPEAVFDYLTNVDNLTSWQAGVHSATLDGELGVGGTIRESRTLLGRELKTSLAIEEYDRPRLFTLRAVHSPLTFTVRHELAPNGAGTVLTVVGEGDAGPLPGFATGIVKRRAERQFRKDFERLKLLLES